MGVATAVSAAAKSRPGWDGEGESEESSGEPGRGAVGEGGRAEESNGPDGGMGVEAENPGEVLAK